MTIKDLCLSVSDMPGSHQFSPLRIDSVDGFLSLNIPDRVEFNSPENKTIPSTVWIPQPPQGIDSLYKVIKYANVSIEYPTIGSTRITLNKGDFEITLRQLYSNGVFRITGNNQNKSP